MMRARQKHDELLKQEGTAEALAEAQALLREVVAGFEAQFPPSHP
eukprot:COSAG06_NODE_17913_length_914_cov_1.738650_1_plen_44_part_10